MISNTFGRSATRAGLKTKVPKTMATQIVVFRIFNIGTKSERQGKKEHQKIRHPSVTSLT